MFRSPLRKLVGAAAMLHSLRDLPHGGLQQL